MCGYFPYIACIPSHTRLLAFLFLDALTIFQLISADLAAPYHFHIQCKGLHFRGWLLVFLFIPYSSVWAVFGVLFVDFLLISLYDWTEQRSIEMKSDIAHVVNWECML